MSIAELNYLLVAAAVGDDRSHIASRWRINVGEQFSHEAQVLRALPG